MSIDWFTVTAQALNFLILVWLLKRFLYRPILDAIDAREERIAAELADADAQKAAANEQREALADAYAAFEQQRAVLLAQANSDASVERQQLSEAAHKAIKLQRDEWEKSLRVDAHNLEQAISQRAQQEVFAIVRKVLAELATTELETAMCAVFIRHLRALDAAAKDRFAAALANATDTAILRTAFDLPAPTRATIQAALDEVFATPVRLRFETAPALVGGIELSSSGQKLGWSIDAYLVNLEQSIDELLKGQPRNVAGAKFNKVGDAAPVAYLQAPAPAPGKPQP